MTERTQHEALVERLRKRDERRENIGNGCSRVTLKAVDPDKLEAAAAITDLIRERDEARAKALKVILKTTQTMAHGFRGQQQLETTKEDCACAASNAGVFVAMALGYSPTEIGQCAAAIVEGA